MVKDNSQTKNPAENVEKKKQRLPYKNETTMWNVQHFCVTFVLECGFLVKKVVSFSFTLDWFLFLHFFLQARKIFE